MADDLKPSTALGALALGWLLLRKSPQSQPASSGTSGGTVDVPTTTGTGAAARTTTDDPSTLQQIGKVGAAVAPVLKKTAPVLGALGTTIGAGGAGSSVALGGAAVALELVGTYVGYRQAGTTGGIIGAVNPIVGNAGIAGFKLGEDVAQDLGANQAATTTAGAGGAIIGVLVSLGELAAAAALLPTIGLAIGLAELLGAIFGSGNAPPPEATPQQKVDNLFAIATNSSGVAFLNLSASDRVNAAAQLLAWANGPATLKLNLGGLSTTQTNPFRFPARERVMQLGAGADLT